MDAQVLLHLRQITGAQDGDEDEDRHHPLALGTEEAGREYGDPGAEGRHRQQGCVGREGLANDAAAVQAHSPERLRHMSNGTHHYTVPHTSRQPEQDSVVLSKAKNPLLGCGYLR